MRTPFKISALLCALILYCFVSELSAQGSIEPLVWFKTEVNHPTNDRENGKWVDHGPYNVEIKYANAVNDPLMEGYDRDVYSMNFNPALYFGDDRDQNGDQVDVFSFVVKGRSPQNVTVMAVLVPIHRYDPLINPVQTEYVMQDRDRYVRSLNVNEVDLHDANTPFGFDYGADQGTDLYIESGESGYEEQKYGKIVTYNTLLRPDRCMDGNTISQQIFDVYSQSKDIGIPDANNIIQQKGLIPEFIIFDRRLDKGERFEYETHLALKYGISKELDYTAGGEKIWDDEKMALYPERITGIGHGVLDLVQSRSTSYYDEIEETYAENNENTSRYTHYEDDVENDYSRHKERLLTIGIEDESSEIDERWGNGYAIWGSNTTAIEATTKIFDEDEYLTVGRHWALQKTEGADSSVTPSWCNFIDMRVQGGIYQKDYYTINSRVGCMATSQPIDKSIDPFIAQLNWEIRGRASSSVLNNIVGFSDDNMVFAKGGIVDEQSDFIVALEFVGGAVNMLIDEDGDGSYDSQATINSVWPSYNLDDIFNLRIEKNNQGNYVYKAFKNDQSTPNSEYEADYG